MYVKDMPSVAMACVDRRSPGRRTDLGGLELDDDRIEAAYAIVELGERGSQGKTVEFGTSEVEEDLDVEEADHYHQVPRSPECLRQCRRNHCGHSNDSSPARTPTATGTSSPQQLRVSHVRGAVMPSRTSGKPVQKLTPKRRLEDDGTVKAKLARMLSDRKSGSQEDNGKADADDEKCATGVRSEEDNSDDELNQCGRFVRTSMPLLEPIVPVSYTQSPTRSKWNDFCEKLEVKLEESFSNEEIDRFRLSFCKNKTQEIKSLSPEPKINKFQTLSTAVGVTDQKPKTKSMSGSLENSDQRLPSADLVDHAVPSGLSQFWNFQNYRRDHVPSLVFPRVAKNAGVRNMDSFQNESKVGEVDPKFVSAFPSLGGSQPLLFLGSPGEGILSSDRGLLGFLIPPPTKSSSDHGFPEGRVRADKPSELQRELEPLRKLEQLSLGSLPYRDLQSMISFDPARMGWSPSALAGQVYPQFGSLNCLSNYGNNRTSLGVAESKSCEDLARKSPDSRNFKVSQQQILSANETRSQSNESASKVQTSNQLGSQRNPRRSKGRNATINDAFEMVKGGEFGSLRTIRMLYDSLRSQGQSESSKRSTAESRLCHITDRNTCLSSQCEGETFQDSPLDLSGYRRRLSQDQKVELKCFPTYLQSLSNGTETAKVSSTDFSSQKAQNSLDAELASLPARILAGSSSSFVPNSHLPPKKRKLRLPSQGCVFSEASDASLTSDAASSSSLQTRYRPKINDSGEFLCNSAPSNRLAHPLGGENRLQNNGDLQTDATADKLYAKGFPPTVEADELRMVQKKNAEELSLVSAVATRDEDGDLPIHIAVAQGSIEIVRKLLPVMAKVGISVDTCNNSRQTALHLAVISNQPEMVELLLQSSASPCVCDRKGNTAVHLAVKYRTSKCLKFLLANSRVSLDLDARNYEGLTALHLGVQLSDRVAVESLLTSGANANATDGTNGRTPLFYAVEINSSEMASLLLNYGSDPYIASYSGCTPLHIATAKAFRNIAGILEKGSRREFDAACNDCGGETF